MTTVDATSKNDLSPDWLRLLQAEFRSERITDDEVCATIRQVLSDHQYMIDPHTAVAFAAAKKFGYYATGTTTAKDASKMKPVILLSTASPCKFEESVTVAVGPEGWKKYYQTEFPLRGKAILERDEIEPFHYKATDGLSLEESQNEWEAKSASIIADLGNVKS